MKRVRYVQFSTTALLAVMLGCGGTTDPTPDLNSTSGPPSSAPVNNADPNAIQSSAAFSPAPPFNRCATESPTPEMRAFMKHEEGTLATGGVQLAPGSVTILVKFNVLRSGTG